MNHNSHSEGNPIDFYRVPEEVIKAWERGEYFTGNVPSLAYKYLGIALGLRGLYTYTGTDKNDFKGVARIDLKGQELIMEGVRLWDQNDKPDIKFWKTEFSHFLSDNNIIWTYRVFDCRSDDNLLPHLGCEKLPENIEDKDSKARFGFAEEQWKKLFQFLLGNEFSPELKSIEDKCAQTEITRVMLHFDISDRKNNPAGPIKAKYRQLYEGGSDIAGDSQFERVSVGN